MTFETIKAPLKGAIIALVTTISAPAFAGSGSLDGGHVITINGNSDRPITCNSHRFGSDGAQRFACEYTNRVVLGNPNDSLFIGEISTANKNGRDRAFYMVQFDDQNQYSTVYSGQVSSGGQVSGTLVDDSGNTGMTFTIN